MTDAFDVRAEFATGITDAPGAWRFIRSFAARYATAIADGDGFEHKQLAAAEARLRLRLRRSLRDAYGCQHVAEWGVPLSAVVEPDPPVVFRVRSTTPAENSWQPFLERVSLASMEMVLSEWLFSGGTPAGNRALDDEAVSLLERRFRRLAMPEYPLWSGGGSISWYVGSGAILRARRSDVAVGRRGFAGSDRRGPGCPARGVADRRQCADRQ